MEIRQRPVGKQQQQRQSQQQQQRAGAGDARMAMPAEDDKELKYRQKRRERRDMGKGILYYSVFLALFLGLPILIVVYNTPFFVFQNLRCRARDVLWLHDTDTHAMAQSYQRYFDTPPLYLSSLYNQTMHWGTYDPSHIFAVTNRAARPVTIGIAWYDRDRAHPLRQGMPFIHNKVNAPRASKKKGADPEVMQVRWVTHDGIHYGKQAVLDPANRLDLMFEFLKSPSGLAWHVRVHGRVEGRKGVEMVIFVANSDADGAVEVLPPGEEHNDGDWSPILRSYYTNAQHRREPFSLRIYDDHNPLFDTQPWRIHGVRANASEAFALVADDTVGGTVAEREAAQGRGIASGERAATLQRRRLDLRELPPSAFEYISAKDPHTFRESGSGGQHNIIVLRKFYDSDFRWEMSLSPARHGNAQGTAAAAAADLETLVPEYTQLSTCQLTNMFRNRAKAIDAHALKVFRPWATGYNVSRKLYMRIGRSALGEAFGSLAHSAGRYLRADVSVDEAQEAQGEAVVGAAAASASPAPHTSTALALVGSRTDEAFGRLSVTGLFAMFLVRWNKEVAKDVIASWVLGSQDPATGFVPARATMTAAARSLAPAHLRYEHPTFASPPTLLLALKELLREVERKAARVQGKKRGMHKGRNQAPYLAREAEADKEYLRHLLVGLRRWRAWWHTTQCGGLSEAAARGCGAGRVPLERWPRVPTSAADTLAYRWRSRDGARLPASGMDDYPRRVCPGEHELEAHVDAFAWVALLSQLISRIEERHLGLPPSVAVDWEAHLRAAHWDAGQRRFADRAGCAGQPFSPYVGYANLHPVMLGVVSRDAEAVAATVELARRELWSEYGLMSVSYASVRRAREDGLTHDNAFSGYVWPSFNLMWLHGIRSTYAERRDRAAAAAAAGEEEEGGEGGTLASITGTDDFYTQLHRQMVEAIRYGSRWWEYFNPVDGSGKGSKTYVGTYALLPGLLEDYQ